jgi:maltose alpha-D-glucosyltransferase/alpha-amylase
VGQQPDLSSALADWLPSRRWFAGKGRPIDSIALDEIEVPQSQRVRLLIAHVTFADGEAHSYSVPLLVDEHGEHGLPLTDAMSVERGASVIADLALGSGHDHRVRLLGGEQSNSSVIVDEVMIAKLVRRLEPGPNPDVDVPRHLSRVGFAHAPGLIAQFDVDLAGGTANAVIVHDAIANHGDLWTWISDHPTDAFDIAGLLGRRTAELHTALATTDRGSAASADFWPEPSTLDDQRAELDSVRRSLLATQALLGDRSRHLAAPAEVVLARFGRLADDVVDTSRIRIHGDLHLGQILWTGDDVMFIDFEGEPARPMAERSAKRPGLVDVAGLLRSFDYAGRSAGRDVEWVTTANRRLLDAYLATIRPPLISGDDDDTRLLLDLYLLDKALYEIRYEIASRPEWLHLPLRAAEELVAAEHS